ncbi:MAG: glycosyltransferase family 4 protein [Rhodocyclaceae bacterium]
MKIILTVHQFLPEHATGTEILTLETARSLRASGHEVVIVTGAYSPDALRDDERFDRYEYDGFAVERYRFSPSPIGGSANYSELDYRNPLFAEHFRNFLRTFQPDIVHAFHLMRLSALVVDVCHEEGVPIVFTPTDFWFVCPYVQLLKPDHSPCQGPDDDALNCLRHYLDVTGSRSRITRLVRLAPDALLRPALKAVRDRAAAPPGQPQGRLTRLTERAGAVARRPAFLMARLNRMARVLAPTRFMGEVLTRHGLHASRLEYLPFGIKLDGQHTPVPRKPSSTLRVGYIGTLSPHKGAHVLIDAVRHLIPKDFDFECRIYGKLTDFPDHVKWLQTMAAEDERIRFLGTFPNDRIGDIFADLDVLVVPSIWYENTPLVIYSAQANLCPVIASDFPGMSEVISDGDNGLLFPAEDWHGLAMRLIDLYRNRDRVQAMSARARAPASVDQYATRLVEVYEETLSGRPAGAPAHSTAAGV